VSISEQMIGNNREYLDWYATRPIDVENLLAVYGENIGKNIWECACGKGHISDVLKKHGYNVYSTDIIDRGYNDFTCDFLKTDMNKYKFDAIITNPPYKYASEFVEHALNQLNYGGYAIFLLRTLFVDGQDRYDKLFSKNNPKVIYHFVKRTFGLIGGDINNPSSSAMSHSWMIWQKGYDGDTSFRWLDNR